jgi:hypothetical protein
MRMIRYNAALTGPSPIDWDQEGNSSGPSTRQLIKRESNKSAGEPEKRQSN